MNRVSRSVEAGVLNRLTDLNVGNVRRFIGDVELFVGPSIGFMNFDPVLSRS